MGCANCKIPDDMKQKAIASQGEGPVTVTLISATLGKNAQLFGQEGAVYVTVNFGEEPQHKFPVSSGINPRWGGDAIWTGQKKPEIDDLVLFHVHVTQNEKDEIVGVAGQSLKDFSKGGIARRSLDFINPETGESNGQIEIETKYEPKGKDKNPVGGKDPNGMVQIKIISAEFNRVVGELNDLNTFLAFSCGQNRQKTTVKQGVKPVWENDVVMLRRHWTNNEIRINVHQKQQWQDNYTLGYGYISLSLPIVTPTQLWYQIYHQGQNVGKIQLKIDFFDRPEKFKKPKHKQLKVVEMLPEDKKAYEEERKKVLEDRANRKKEKPDASITETSDGPDFSDTSSVDSDDINFDQDAPDLDENEVNAKKEKRTNRVNKHLDKNCKRGFRKAPKFIQNQFKTREERQKFIDEKIKPKANEELDKRTPKWETGPGETAEFAYFEGNAKYVGEFRAGVKHGKGDLTWQTGDTYVGEWKRDRMHGNGHLTTSIFTYQGEFRYGRFHGDGTWTTEQYIWSGTFKAGKKHGRVKVTDKATSKVIEGEFKDGEFIRWHGSDLHHEELSTSILRNGFEHTQIWSQNKNYVLKASINGTLVLRKQGKFIWESDNKNTPEEGPYYIQVKNGNLRVVSNKGTVTWQSGSSGKGSLILRDDGLFQILAEEGDAVLWKSPTEQGLGEDVKDIGQAAEQKAGELLNDAKGLMGKIGF